MKPRACKIAGLILLLSLAAGEAKAQVVYDGILFTRSNRWDSYPSHLLINGKHHIWWCGQSGIGGSWGQWVDAIFRTVKTGSLGPGGWSSPAQVFNNTHSPWALNHVCDPTVVRAGFSYNGKSYVYALYYTADTSSTTPGVDNAVGLAFSNDGVTWTAYPSIVITTYAPFNGTYGAGASGVAINPHNGRLMQAYDDTTISPKSRLKESTDGISFSPSPPYATALNSAGRGESAAPDIAYYPGDKHWYAVIQTFDVQGTWGGESRVLRSTNRDDLFGSWELIGTFNPAVTGHSSNNNPGLGKIVDSSLYVDTQGWGYVFLGAGSSSNPWTWDLAQGRFRPGGVPSQVIVTVSPSQPGYLAVSGDALASYSPLSAVVSIPGGTTANTDNLWNAMADFQGKPGFNAFVSAGAENSPIVTASVGGLRFGTQYDVYGRYGTAVLQEPPNYYGIEMGLSSTSLSRYDQTNTNHTVVNNWSNWQEWEVYLGVAAVGSDGSIHLFLDDNSVTKAATWTGMRLVKR